MADNGCAFPALAVFFPEVLAVFFLDCDHLQPLLVRSGMIHMLPFTIPS
jgi:hypothetical protein